MSAPMCSPLQPRVEAGTCRLQIVLDVIEEEDKERTTWIWSGMSMGRKVTVALSLFMAVVLCLSAWGIAQGQDSWRGVGPVVALAKKALVPAGDKIHFTVNLVGIIGVLVCGALLAQQHQTGMYRLITIILVVMQLLPLAVWCRAVYHFITSERGSSSSVGFHKKLADLGVWALLSAIATGENLCESLLTTSVQVYSIIDDFALAQDTTILLSVAMGIFALATAFTTIYIRGHVSRYVSSQPVVGGVGKPASFAIAAVILYRLSSIISQMLLMAMLQQIVHEEKCDDVVAIVKHVAESVTMQALTYTRFLQNGENKCI